MSVGVNVSPTFIKAKTADQLERKMASTNVKRGTYIKFHSIQYVDGWWFAWFDIEHKTNLKRDL